MDIITYFQQNWPMIVSCLDADFVTELFSGLQGQEIGGENTQAILDSLPSNNKAIRNRAVRSYLNDFIFGDVSKLELDVLNRSLKLLNEKLDDNGAVFRLYRTMLRNDDYLSTYYEVTLLAGLSKIPNSKLRLHVDNPENQRNFDGEITTITGDKINVDIKYRDDAFPRINNEGTIDKLQNRVKTDLLCCIALKSHRNLSDEEIDKINQTVQILNKYECEYRKITDSFVKVQLMPTPIGATYWWQGEWIFEDGGLVDRISFDDIGEHVMVMPPVSTRAMNDPHWEPNERDVDCITPESSNIRQRIIENITQFPVDGINVLIIIGNGPSLHTSVDNALFGDSGKYECTVVQGVGMVGSRQVRIPNGVFICEEKDSYKRLSGVIAISINKKTLEHKPGEYKVEIKGYKNPAPNSQISDDDLISMCKNIEEIYK